jgi:hypothetical protein
MPQKSLRILLVMTVHRQVTYVQDATEVTTHLAGHDCTQTSNIRTGCHRSYYAIGVQHVASSARVWSFLWRKATPVIVGSSAGHMWKNNSKWYTLPSKFCVTFIQYTQFMRLVRHATCTEDSRGTYRVLVGRPEGRRPLEISRQRREVNIKMDHQELRWEHGLD